tara:strand:+ start:53128 stop:53571 length:444 start_codon:yes stop_codon:yes gene_type:complete
MSSPLYSHDILRLAASLAGQQRLDAPDATADCRSPTCGSRVIVDVRLDDQGRISALGLDARACALGQASAALMAAHALGRNSAELEEALAKLDIFLHTQDRVPDASFWPGVEVFAPARAYPARHPSILLSFQAVRDAVRQAAQQAGA